MSRNQIFSSKRIAFIIYEKFWLLIIGWSLSFTILWNNVDEQFSMNRSHLISLICVIIGFIPISYFLARLCVESIETIENGSRSIKYAMQGHLSYSDLDFTNDYERDYPLT
jgi:hypothetical protein